MVKLHSLNPGDRVLVKVGRNLISCEVVAVRPDRAVVRSESTGREFKTMRVEELVSRAGSVVAEAMEYVAERVAEAVAPQAAQAAATPELAAVVADAAEPAQDAPKPRRKLSLVSAGIEVMKQEGRPLNTREIVRLAAERGLWTPTACRTPEQSLYGAFFLEMKNSDSPRIRKSAERGKFELA